MYKLVRMLYVKISAHAYVNSNRACAPRSTSKSKLGDLGDPHIQMIQLMSLDSVAESWTLKVKLD